MDFAIAMSACLPNTIPDQIGVAVSGGGDSTALLLMMRKWADKAGVKLAAATVNHGLRPEAAAEAAQVAQTCARLGVAHETLYWTGWDHMGNIQAEARKARYRLLAEWAKSRDISTVALGHTSEDQAETVLMRLIRGSGVDGLAGMTPTVTRSQISWIRPLLSFAREDLRGVLRGQNVDWCEDPSNQDDSFLRIRIRKLMGATGLKTDGLVKTAARMQSARRFLELSCQTVARQLAQVTPLGDIEIDFAGFMAMDTELQTRLMAHSLQWVASTPYRPRLDSLHTILKTKDKISRQTLAGCVVETNKTGVLRVSREYNAVRDEAAKPDAVWDRRWIGSGPEKPDGVTIRALGENGLSNLKNWRGLALPRNSLIASPVVWQNSKLIAAPLAGWPNGWTIGLQKGADHYFSSILSH